MLRTMMPELGVRQSGADSSAARTVNRPVRLALAGGGTGGHIVPGLHLLSAIGEGERPVDVVWFTSGRAVEERVLGAARELLTRTPFERVALALEPVGGGAPSRSRLVVRTPSAVMTARKKLLAHRSDVLVGLGGFTSLPAVLAARSLRIPIVLLEVNAHAGAATKWLSRFATRVVHAWPATLPPGVPVSRDVDTTRNGNSVHRFVGPPLATSYARHAVLPETQREVQGRAARTALGFDPARPLFVVLGGSQGSTALNRFVHDHVTAFNAAGLSVLHQTGPKKLSEAASARTGYCAVEYVDDVFQALSGATVVLARGGASTLAEIGAMRVPCFVAPYPGHADMHQTKNAEQLGIGARIVPDSQLNARARDEILALALEGGVEDRARMQRALADAVPTDAASRMWREITHSIRDTRESR
ncbi:MAG: UDP-N-acetylglucosamine--N-acetylmuramyl-(pentapeptide) pyrophosphoryl-undecaprenol N-acetylglucosamine transferase [Planctomycetota bacterium]|nr:UDP-N-acetylglucosamine--N-acetylmuramyl-(pentapeptide) pyrophosphoryl-undecaprenol N-acetylglucosamine transferase [Planctomycetota bacterium]